MLAQLLIFLLVVEKSFSVPTPLESTPYYPPDVQSATILPNETKANTTFPKHSSTIDHVLSFTDDLIHLHQTNHPFAWLMNIFGPIFYPTTYPKYISRLNRNNRRLQREQILNELQNNKTNSYPTNKTIQTNNHTINELTNLQTTTNEHTIQQTILKTNEQQIQTTETTNNIQNKQTTTTTPTTVQTTQTTVLTEHTTLREFPTHPPNYTLQTTETTNRTAHFPRPTAPPPENVVYQK